MQKTMNEPFALDTKGAAKFLGVSKSHLEKLRTEDPESSPPFFKVGRCVRYSVQRLVEWSEGRGEGQEGFI
jgi:hypothetical protein